MSFITSIVTDSKKLVYILGGGIGVLIFLTVFLVLSRSTGGGAEQKAQLVMWGVFDDQAVMADVISPYEKANKNVQITYIRKTYETYEEELLNALAAGTGPDIWMLHHTWLPKHQDKLAALSSKFTDAAGNPLMTVRSFEQQFVEVAAADLIADGTIYALPLYADTLAMYYNRDMFTSAGIARPPVTWEEFNDAVGKLVVRDENGNITRAAAAIGTYKNINRASDILMMLMLQLGTRMTNEARTEATFAQSVSMDQQANTKPGENALKYYTQFSERTNVPPKDNFYTWNDQLDWSVDAFAAGKVAIMFNYAHQIPVLRDIAPRLNWAIAPVPQPTTTESRTYANYWALGVSRASKQQAAAWTFVHYLTAGQGNGTYLDLTGRPAALRAFVEQQTTDADLGVFAEQALTARSWYQVDSKAAEAAFRDMIDAVLYSKTPVAQALREAEDRMSLIYGR